MISLDVDPGEDADLLRRYADQEGWPWRHAMAPREMLEALSQEFGTRFLVPPSDPTLFIATSGEGQAVFGQKDEARLRELVAEARR